MWSPGFAHRVPDRIDKTRHVGIFSGFLIVRREQGDHKGCPYIILMSARIHRLSLFAMLRPFRLADDSDYIPGEAREPALFD